MERDLGFAAALEAEKVLKEVGITSLPIDPFVIARHYNIEVAAKPAHEEGVSGMLVRVGDFYAIGYATSIDNEGYQRFSVSHELGHYFMPGHLEAVLGESDVHQSRAGFVSRDRFEQEADHFAANLLMPRRLFTDALRKAGSGIDGLERLRCLCRTSMLSTAIRYSQCSPEPVAVIVGANGTVDYCFMSQALKDLKGIDWIRKREKVPQGTPTLELHRSVTAIESGARMDGTSDLRDWFGGSRSLEITEEVIGLGRYGKSLTLLYDIELPDPEDEDDDDALRESWTPRFRR